ncbi:hypothetical protein BDW27_1081, partial [Nocardiopsis sp. L17-MgMaSL7]
MVPFPAVPAPTTGSTPVDTAMRTAREQATTFFDRELTPG